MHGKHNTCCMYYCSRPKLWDLKANKKSHGAFQEIAGDSSCLALATLVRSLALHSPPFLPPQHHDWEPQTETCTYHALIMCSCLLGVKYMQFSSGFILFLPYMTKPTLWSGVIWAASVWRPISLQTQGEKAKGPFKFQVQVQRATIAPGPNFCSRKCTGCAGLHT